MTKYDQKQLNILIHEGVAVEEDLILSLASHMEKMVENQAVKREAKNKIIGILDRMKVDSERHKKLLEEIAQRK